MIVNAMATTTIAVTQGFSLKMRSSGEALLFATALDLMVGLLMVSLVHLHNDPCL